MKRKTIEARKAVRSVIGLLAVAWIGLAAAGCGIEDTNGSKIEDVEFTVLEEEAVPEELKQEQLQEVDDYGVIDEDGNVSGGFESRGKVYEDKKQGKCM